MCAVLRTARRERRWEDDDLQHHHWRDHAVQGRRAAPRTRVSDVTFLHLTLAFVLLNSYSFAYNGIDDLSWLLL